MILQVVRSSCVALVCGFALHFVQMTTGSDYLTKFFENNLINLMAGLLAVNSATIEIVLTKIRELIDRSPAGADFSATRDQMALAFKEQMMLLAIAVALLTVRSAAQTQGGNALVAVDVGLAACFVYTGLVLYDVAMSIFVILDYDRQ